MAGRFHLRSIVFNTDVWSYTVWDTKCGLLYGETTTVGTRKP